MLLYAFLTPSFPSFHYFQPPTSKQGGLLGGLAGLGGLGGVQTLHTPRSKYTDQVVWVVLEALED